MSSVGLAVALLVGTGVGLLAIGQHPDGLEPGHGWAALALALACFIPLAIGWTDRRTRWACLLLMVGLVGGGRALLTHPPITPSDLAYYNGEPGSARVAIVGSVAAEPLYRDRLQRVRVSARSIQTASNAAPKPVFGDMYAILPRYPVLDIGESLVLSGTLTEPPALEGFDYRAYLARQGIFSYMSYPRVTRLGPGESTGLTRLVADARSRVREALRRSIAEPQAALSVGVVTGDRTSIPQDVQEAFLRSGTTHIMAISGQNISLLVGAVWLFYSGLTRRQRMSLWMLLMVLLMLAAYTLFTGATPSVVRAAITGGVLLSAPFVFRRYDPIAALGVSASLMVLADPNLLANLGFQFSFAAMLGIVFLGPPVYNTLKRLHVPDILNLLITTGVAAQAGAGPLMIFNTGIASLVSIPATITAQLVLLPLMISGILTGLFGLISDQVAALTGYAAWLCASWLLWWVQFWGSLPWAASDVKGINPLWIGLYYTALGAALWLMEERKRWQLQARPLPPRGLLVLAAIAVGLWVVLVAMLVAR